MKARDVLLVFCFALGANRGQAQDYIPFPDSNAAWFCQKATRNCYDSHPWENQVYSYDTVGDTLIADLTYHKLAVTNYCVECCDEPLFVGYAGAFRNDVNNRKVLLVLPDSTEEVVWYDFSAGIGDTLEFSLPLYIGNCTRFVLLETDSILVAGAYRRSFRWVSIDGCWESQDVEGMGSLNGLFERNMAALDINGFLHCFTVDGVELWSDGLDMCSVPMALVDNGISPVTLYAVVQGSALVLTRSGDADFNGQVTVFDPSGGTLLSERLTGLGTARIMVPDLSKGVYIIRYQEGDQPAGDVVRLVVY